MDSDTWRPFDPVDDDQGGAWARWRRWMRVLISVFVVSVKRQVEPERGAATTGRVSSSDADYDDDGEDYDDDGEDYDSDGDSGDSDYTWLARA
jgi:hypothetical protein